ncbi:DHA2 family efflux MFS transporter permease subunit [Frankia sp. CNm7]|uniref:DHA2 family efflux MFS transporter permease subunit n=1 Tax=Frankia nepalensis TaxID=1836974 RepID=A0A937RSE3_9ACTN|nr:DHA2 family efflux MFS transporter permease subunit [Frankia nepalensis]MBL7497631.1 DHA2 family efflux MFS transporter permease subunit [Frankia nepalensis]MBL7510055.1 DHA2 family efflux MFS transporter permease subunit [Frankia nepalensis]MBL7517535.1 DHA2 family efflux MFS transporter permease subunit [Frankia nepalensis]MBL7631076.1 DHA2 family efflux MFS transporter permease subunit [Frankia nepalensis]
MTRSTDAAAGAMEAPSAPATGTSANPGTAARLDRHTRLMMAVLVLGGLMVVLDVTITNVAIRDLSVSLGAPLPVIQWVSSGYTLALAVVVPTTAWLAGRLGTRRVYLGALGLFLLGSVLAGLAWNIESLIAFRVVQGLGGGLINPVAMTIVLRAAPPATRGRAMGLLGLPVLVGPLVGPTLGGWLVGFSWRWIFLINVPVGLLALAMAWRFLRPLPSADEGRARLDVLGLALVAPGLALVVYGLAESGRLGTLAAPSVLVPALLGLGLCAAFVLRALRVPDPLVQVRLLRHRALASGTATLALFASAYFGSMLLVPLYWQLVRGQSPAQAGMLAIPQALTTGIALQVASRLVDRVAPAKVVGAGVTLAAGGMLATALLLSADRPFWQLVVTMAVAGAGAGATIMPTITTALRHLPDRHTPSGSTLLSIINQVSVALGTALTSVLLVAQLAGTTATGGRGELPDPAGGAASGELARAFHDTMLLPVALMAAAAVLALLLLPRGRGNTP